jgi:hypothetical protein
LTTMERSSPLGMPEEIGGSSILARKAWFFDFQLGDEFVSIHGVSPAGDILSHWTGIVLHWGNLPQGPQPGGVADLRLKASGPCGRTGYWFVR